MFSRTIMAALVLLTLSACSVNIPNLEPLQFQKFESASENKLQRRFGDVKALLFQIQELKNDVFEERLSGSDYSKTIQRRTEELIVLNRTLGDGAVELYSGCVSVRQVHPEIVQPCKNFVDTVFSASELSDELYQLLLGYTYAGLEMNPAFLTSRNEKRVNTLINEQRALITKVEEPMLAFRDVLMQTACCDIPPRIHRYSNPNVVFLSGENEATKLLTGAIQLASKGTVLNEYPIEITVTVSRLEMQGIASSIGHVATFLLVGYPGGGGDATISATVSRSGDTPTVLEIDTFDMNARDPDVLISLVADRIVSDAHFVVLKNILKAL
ncbi:hypothetical protein ACFL6I_18145 [candidate division KSB1 bacterium]